MRESLQLADTGNGPGHLPEMALEGTGNGTRTYRKWPRGVPEMALALILMSYPNVLSES